MDEGFGAGIRGRSLYILSATDHDLEPIQAHSIPGSHQDARYSSRAERGKVRVSIQGMAAVTVPLCGNSVLCQTPVYGREMCLPRRRQLLTS